MDVRVQKIVPEIIVPTYAKPSDAGFDLRSAENLVLKPGERKPVSTGIAIAIPENFVLLIWDRSGNALNFGVHCLGGVIDAGYRGEIRVILQNFGDKDFEIKKNERIAQGLVQPVIQANLKLVDKLDSTHRGASGFGSSGKE